MDNLPETGAGVKPPVFHNAREHYRFVNSLWPRPIPKLDGPEAISAAKRLWRVATGKPWKGKWKLTSGNRFSAYPDYQGFPVNAEKGWRALVHDISHSAHRRINRRGRPHDGNQARLEAKLIRYVVEHGWLDGKLKPKPKAPKVKPTKEERAQARLKRIDELMRAWETKAKRAATALKKLRAEERRLKRASERR